MKKYCVKTNIKDNRFIESEIYLDDSINDIRTQMTKMIYDTQDEQIKKCLVSLGWINSHDVLKKLHDMLDKLYTDQSVMYMHQNYHTRISHNIDTMKEVISEIESLINKGI